MCGIAGFVGRGGRADLERMARALAHRGPDAEALWIAPEGDVHLAHRRLAVVDLEGGAQPMWTADGALGVVFNGEIYDHRALRSELDEVQPLISAAVLAATAFRLRDNDGLVSALRILVGATKTLEERRAS